jgi:hypothetical protein
MGAADRSESDHQPLPDLIETFENAAIAAGREILAARAAGARVSIKSDSTPVTQADRAAEAIILAKLTEQFPDVPVVAEEMAEDGKCPNSTQASYFLVDALDGTGDFIAGRNEFTVNVALIRDLKRPRMWSAAFSPTMIEGALVLPLVTCGKIDESASLRPSTPITPRLSGPPRRRDRRAPHPAGAAGVIGAFGMFPDRVVERRVVGCVAPGRISSPRNGSIGLLGHDLPRQADRAAEIDPVLIVAHVVEQDRGRRGGGGPAQRHAPRLSDRIGPTWAWKPCPSATVEPS